VIGSPQPSSLSRSNAKEPLENASHINAGAKIDRITPLTRRDAVYFRSGVYTPVFHEAATPDNSFLKPKSGGLVLLRRITPLTRRDAVYFRSGLYISCGFGALSTPAVLT
jgi:hypothetical protein